MALETATYISGLVSTNPLPSDPKSQGDDHIRLIKSTILATFPNITGAVTATQAELNYISGVTSGIQGQIDSKTRLNGISAANASATLANAANQISWNWALTGASGKGLSVSETAASTGGAGSQDLVSIGTLASSTANPLRVTARGSDAILVGSSGAVGINAVGVGNVLTLTTQDVSVTGQTAGSVNISAGKSTAFASGSGGSVSISAGDGPSVGGDITLTPGSGPSTKGRINFVNSSVSNGSVASAFTASVGPTGASTSIVGWLAIKVGGTARYIPYW